MGTTHYGPSTGDQIAMQKLRATGDASEPLCRDEVQVQQITMRWRGMPILGPLPALGL